LIDDINFSEKLLLWYARHFPFRKGKLRLVEALWRKAVEGGDRQRVAELAYGGFRMPCDLAEMLQRQFYFFGTYFVEEDILDCWRGAAKGAKVILDVGANAGIYSLAALAVEPKAMIHAFEPTPEIAERLRKTARLNGLCRLHVHEMAVSSKSGHAILRRFRGELGTNEGMNFICTEPGTSRAHTVATTCLDEFCQQQSIDYVDLLKLDIQGHEYAALKGANHLIRDGRVGTIFMELNWGVGASCSANESIHLLQQAGYVFAKPAEHLRWQESGDWLHSLTDVVARTRLMGL
jgi:FkbM family methyltransferase